MHVWRAQTCTFQGPRIQKHHQIQREDARRDTKRTKGRRKREKKRNFGLSGAKWSGAGWSTNTSEMEGGGQTQNNCGPEGWAPEGRVPSPRKGLGLWGSGFSLNVDLRFFGVWDVFVQPIWPKHYNTKIGQRRFGQSRLVKVGLAKVGHSRNHALG